MSVASVEGPSDPSRASGTGLRPTSAVPGAAPAAAATAAAGAGQSGNDGGQDTPRHGFHAPELTSGLLSDNVTPWQREGLGRLARLLRMAPKDVLSALQSRQNLGQLLAARRLGVSALVGRFDKGLLLDAQA